MLREILSSAPFFLRIVSNEKTLSQVFRTALPWTDTEGALCYVDNRKYLDIALNNECVDAIILCDDLIKFCADTHKCLISCDNPKGLFLFIHNKAIHRYDENPQFTIKPYISHTASIHPTAIIAENVHIGDNSSIGAYSVINNNTFIDQNVFIGPNTIIGEDGLYSTTLHGSKEHIIHWGGVRIGSGSRIAAHCVVACATYYEEYTRIEEDVHISFHGSIGHDCVVGKGCDLSSHVAVGGRTRLGEGCWIGIGALLSNSLRIGAGARIIMGAVVIDNVSENTSVSGNFAIRHHKNLMKKARES